MAAHHTLMFNFPSRRILRKGRLIQRNLAFAAIAAAQTFLA
jgi:hypothetical protein